MIQKIVKNDLKCCG